MQTALFIVVLFGTLLPAAYVLSGYLERILAARPPRLTAPLQWLERATYRILRVDPEREMGWREYARGVLVFSFASFLAVYAIERAQSVLPLNPEGQSAVRPDIAFNTAISFVTNTNWQSYSPEQTMSYLTQMAGLTVQNFASARSASPSPSRSSAASRARPRTRSGTSGPTSCAARSTCCCRSRWCSRSCSSRKASCRRSTARST